MDGQDNDLYRRPDEEELSRDLMSNEEVELRQLLNDFSKNPKDEQTLIRLSEVLLSRQLFEESWLYLDRYIDIVDNDPLAYNYAGFIRFSQGRLDEAEEFFNKSLDLDGNHPNALYNSAMLQLDRGEFDKAKSHFERLSHIEEDNPEIFNNLGAILYQEGNIDSAEDRFHQALAIDPEDISALENIIEILLEKGCIAEAKDYLTKLKDANPPSEELEEMERQVQDIENQAVAKEDDNIGSSDKSDSSEWFPSGVDFSPLESSKNSIESGLNIGIVSDWNTGDRGELAWWIWNSFHEHGHKPSVLARIGEEYHCNDQMRMVNPKMMGKWVVPNLTISNEKPLETSLFESWLKSVKPDLVIFVDEPDSSLVEIAKKSGIMVVACPALEGATRDIASSLNIYDAVVAVTPWIYEALKDEVSVDKLIPSDLGINLTRFSPMIRDKKETVFLYDARYGSVEDIEGLISILTAYSLMSRDANEKSKILIRTAADWTLLPEAIRNRGEGHPRINVISGNIDDDWFLKMGDVLVHLRLSSGIHWMVPQAAASGLPTIILDKSPASGWIYDKHMILKAPRALAPGAGDDEVPRIADPKTLADTMSTMATDAEVVEYMSGVCREKSRQILDSDERSRVLCDKVVTALTSHRSAKAAETPVAVTSACSAQKDGMENCNSMMESCCGGNNESPSNLLNEIEKAIAAGETDKARELMTIYRQHVD